MILLLGLAVARVVRLYHDDAITAPLRDRVLPWMEGRGGVWGWVAEMILCPWCGSGWLSILAVVVVNSATSRDIALPFFSILAVWWVANAAYFLLETLADGDALLWAKRQKVEDDEDDPR